MARVEEFMGSDGIVPEGTVLRSVTVETIVDFGIDRREPVSLDHPHAVVHATDYISLGRRGFSGPQFEVWASTDPTRVPNHKLTRGRPKVVELLPGRADILGGQDDPFRRELEEAGVVIPDVLSPGVTLAPGP